MLCRKIGFVFFKSNLYRYELDYHICFLWKFDINWITSTRSNCHMNMAFIWWAAIENSIFIFIFMIVWVMPQILESWQLFHNMLCGLKTSYSQKFGFSWANLEEVRHPQSWRGHMRSYLFTFFMEQATCALSIFQIHLVHNRHHVLRKRKKKKTPPKLGIICESYWHLNLALAFEQHLEPPPKTSNANLSQNPTCLEYEVFICYLGPHGSGHHPTPIDTFPSTCIAT